MPAKIPKVSANKSINIKIMTFFLDHTITSFFKVLIFQNHLLKMTISTLLFLALFSGVSFGAMLR